MPATHHTTIAALLSISLVHWAALVSPGPNILVVTNLAANGSRRAAIHAALGVVVVAGLWSSLAVFGVQAVFATHQSLRTALQLAGGAYLLHLGINLWRSGGVQPERTPTPLSPLAAFRLGFMTNALNPKSVLFFSSVFATALPARPSPGMLAMAVVVAMLNATIWYLALAFTFSQRRVQAAYARGRKPIARCAGVLLGVYGVRLLFAATAPLRR